MDSSWSLCSRIDLNHSLSLMPNHKTMYLLNTHRFPNLCQNSLPYLDLSNPLMSASWAGILAPYFKDEKVRFCFAHGHTASRWISHYINIQLSILSHGSILHSNISWSIQVFWLRMAPDLTEKHGLSNTLSNNALPEWGLSRNFQSTASFSDPSTTWLRMGTGWAFQISTTVEVPSINNVL